MAKSAVVEKCTLMLCQTRTDSVAVFYALDEAEQWRKREQPMCVDCIEALALALDKNVRPRITPGGAVYVDDLPT